MKRYEQEISSFLLCLSQIIPLLKFTVPDMIMATMTPKSPSALPKISTTRIFTKSVLFWASESAQLLPMIPTQSLHRGGAEQKCKFTLSHSWRSEMLCPRGSWPHFAPANEVGEADGDPRAKHAIAGEDRRRRIRAVRVLRHVLNLCLQNDSNNDPVDGSRLAEDDAA